jgi:hypothetical protein
MSSRVGISLAEMGEPRVSERISREQNSVILEDIDELHDLNRPRYINDSSSVGGAMRGTQSYANDSSSVGGAMRGTQSYANDRSSVGGAMRGTQSYANDRSSVGGAMRGTQSARSSRSSQALGPRLSGAFSSKSLSRAQSASAVAAAADAPSKFYDKFVHFFDFFFPRTFSSLEIPAAFIKNCTRHRSPKNYFTLDKKRTFRAFRIHSSETFRKVHIFCALLLAFLPTIEVPMSLASPCWLSFLLELICYSVISLRVMVDSLCFATHVRAHPWATLMRTALFISWVDVVVCMCLVASNGGSFLSFNNCGMPEPSSEPRSMAWIYIISRVSRFVRPIYFMEWNYRTRYLFNNMVRITSKLFRILSILFVVVFLFAALAYFVWSDPNRYISSFPYRFDYFRSWPSSFVTMMTLTTTENYPDCLIDYMSVSFVNFFFFLIFVLLSVFFALNVVLSTVYDTYEENLQVYFFRRLLRDNATMAQAYQYLCDSDKKLSRERFFKFMKVYSGLNDLDEKKAANREKLQELNMQCDVMFSMCCIRRRLLLSDVNLDLKADIHNGKVSEVVLLQQLEALTKDPILFSDFLELVSLIRCTFVIKKGGARAKSKFENMKRIPFATITTRIAMMSDDGCLKDYPISTHSSSYFFESGDISTRNLATVLARDDGPLNATLVNPGDVYSGIFSAQPPTESANAQSLLQEAPVRRFIRMVHDHKVSKLVCNLIIVLQFVLCVVQTAASNAFMQCSRYTQEDSIATDPWMACDTFSWFRADNAEFVETAFNAAHLSLSSVLLIDIIVVLFLQRSTFLYTEHKEKIDWINIIDLVVQAAIFMYDLIDIPFRASAGAVSRPEFVTFGIFRLLRVHKVLMLSTTIRDTLKLFRHLYPVVKSFFLIAYMFFFLWAILGMSLFSYAATENGIALYPNKSQYISFYDETRRESSTDYPNGNNPGNFGCNDTDVLGSPGLCGEYGPHSPLPFWDITPDSPDEEVALNRAFVIGSGLDARVGGCYNLVGQANDRVLPCYCFYSAEMMNRTTSCDWINPKWYKTQLGQVVLLVNQSPRPCSSYI